MTLWYFHGKVNLLHKIKCKQCYERRKLVDFKEISINRIFLRPENIDGLANIKQIHDNSFQY